MSFKMASVTSYLSENEAKNLQNGEIHLLLNFLTLKWHILRTIWCIDVSNSSFFAFFTLFHLRLTFFRPEVPLSASKLKIQGLPDLHTIIDLYLIGSFLSNITVVRFVYHVIFQIKTHLLLLYKSKTFTNKSLSLNCYYLHNIGSHLQTEYKCVILPQHT